MQGWGSPPTDVFAQVTSSERSPHTLMYSPPVRRRLPRSPETPDLAHQSDLADQVTEHVQVGARRLTLTEGQGAARAARSTVAGNGRLTLTGAPAPPAVTTSTYTPPRSADTDSRGVGSSSTRQ